MTIHVRSLLPAPAAPAYPRRLPSVDGKLAGFCKLRTNRPLNSTGNSLHSFALDTPLFEEIKR